MITGIGVPRSLQVLVRKIILMLIGWSEIPGQSLRHWGNSNPPLSLQLWWSRWPGNVAWLPNQWQGPNKNPRVCLSATSAT